MPGPVGAPTGPGMLLGLALLVAALGALLLVLGPLATVVRLGA